MSTWLALSLAADVVLATSTASAAPISFDEAIGLSVERPDVRGAERAVSEKKSLTQAIPSMTQNPQLYLQPGYRIMAPENHGIEVQGNVMQSWNLAGLSSARKKAARAEQAELSAEARALALSSKLGVARAWIDLWAAERTLVVTRDEAALAADFVKLVEKSVAASAATKADSADARAYQAEARLAVIGAEGATFERGLELSQALSRGGTPLVTTGGLPAPTLPESSTWASLQKRVSTLPDVRQKELAARAERARAVEERAAKGTQLSLGIALQHDQPGGFVAFGAVGLQVPLFDRGERERSVTVARAARLEGERDKAVMDATAQLAMAMHEVEHTEEVVHAIETELLPALDEGLSTRVRIFEAGEATILEVLQARRTRASARSRLERARADHAWASVKVWLLFAAMDEGKNAEGSR